MDLVDMASQTPSHGQILPLSHPRTRCLGRSPTVVVRYWNFTKKLWLFLFIYSDISPYLSSLSIFLVKHLTAHLWLLFSNWNTVAHPPTHASGLPLFIVTLLFFSSLSWSIFVWFINAFWYSLVVTGTCVSPCLIVEYDCLTGTWIWTTRPIWILSWLWQIV